MGSSGAVAVARVYDPISADGGARVLVDRLWPRGVSKPDAALDDWCREVAPSTELRTWYRHDPERFDEFAVRYRAELAGAEQVTALDGLRRLAEQRGLTLLTASKPLELSHAAILAEVITSAS